MYPLPKCYQASIDQFIDADSQGFGDIEESLEHNAAPPAVLEFDQDVAAQAALTCEGLLRQTRGEWEPADV